MLPCLLCYVCVLIAASVNILCISTVVHIVVFVNLILKKMMMTNKVKDSYHETKDLTAKAEGRMPP